MRLLPVLVAAAVFFAGCSSSGGGGDGEPTFEDAFEDTQVASGKGLIRGVVVDAAITPIAGALVAVTGVAGNKTTDANGAFVFADLDPGTYFIQVSKPGWTAVQQSTEVLADVEDPPIVKVSIERVPGTEPRAETLNLEGYISCSIGLPVTFLDCNTIEEQRARLFFAMPTRPTWVQTELVWESTQASGDWLYVIQGICSCDGDIPDVGDARFNETDSALSPYTARADPDFLAEWDAGGEAQEVVIDVSASGPEPETTNGSGIALNQKFNAYVTFFYNFDPDPAWTFAEDGPYQVPPS